MIIYRKYEKERILFFALVLFYFISLKNILFNFFWKMYINKATKINENCAAAGKITRAMNVSYM